MTPPELSAHAEKFLALKRSVFQPNPRRGGQDQRGLRHNEKLIRGFVTYWKQQKHPWPIPSALVLDWVTLGSDRRHYYRDLRRFYIVRGFLQQVRVFEPDTQIPENIFRPLQRRRRPHVYSESDVQRLMEAARKLQTVRPFRRETVYTLIGLLASTGLRIGEALALTVDDVKLDVTPPHLLIRESKFGKSRNVVLHPSTAQRLQNYLDLRAQALRDPDAEALFVNRFGKHLGYLSQFVTFRRLLKRAGIRAVPGQRGPSFHSFRHTFAVRRLTLWHREKKNVQELLPHLAVYLGHLGPENTYWYVTDTPELLETASSLFEKQHGKGGSD
jgi:integrase/recombinase XerD